MNRWNHDISKAPRGRIKLVPATGNTTRKLADPDWIIAASKCGVVCLSYWIDDEKRWNMFAQGEQPIAWMPYDGRKMAGKGANPPAHPTMAASWFQVFLAIGAAA